MLFTSLGLVRIGKNCALRLESSPFSHGLSKKERRKFILFLGFCCFCFCFLVGGGEGGEGGRVERKGKRGSMSFDLCFFP